ncbi:UTP--glucose-1-phosphate uridylyltransferase 3, chloroplastic isoform X1 [Amborella trichopoda]|uniref:UGP3-like C-terminal hexapeptide repeats domain-containing protein n=1 Tax=Amborella trichopoda TaxID=13333 RepID=W1PG51_AMBTC|nr:UTP--glucose-1-phosphate uridylyltransferase 3, chloroplastic isoform X1 [Amborella trichopoda]ERN08982.1 hypothetical protein AMTR_s00153p00036670 [Amborella trichopoda]|eukprot:XP_020524664.1 UTP--glucose-1-phosphate uridylyltransferase 3, chloroplastic isoform X1 [Amborella trichopoda]
MASSISMTTTTTTTGLQTFFSSPLPNKNARAEAHFITSRLSCRPRKCEFESKRRLPNSPFLSLKPTSLRNCLNFKTWVSTVSVEHSSDTPTPESKLETELARLVALRAVLSQANGMSEKIAVLDKEPRVKNFFYNNTNINGGVFASLKLDQSELYLLKCLVASGQGHVLQIDPFWLDEGIGGFDLERENGSSKGYGSSLKSAFYVLLGMIEKFEANGIHNGENHFGKGFIGGEDEAINDGFRGVLRRLLRTLADIENFYDCIGGIIGYQLAVLELLLTSKSGNTPSIEELRCEYKEFHVPFGSDLSEDANYASQAALWGLEGLPELGEIYPLGGSGDRLGLVDPDSGEFLPAAMLPFCGRTLLDGLVRDLQAREFLHFKLFGNQCITPVAIMTSSIKKNHELITSLCETKGWFGRGQKNFRLFEQPLVPTVGAVDGQWLISKPLSLVLKPGGHGVIWKLACDLGIFDWLYSHRRKGATVRQVSNVVAATDVTLLALAGIGHHHGKKMGFASCKRNPGATEGINVLIEKKRIDGHWMYGVTCIEYTEFDKLSNVKAPGSPDGSQAMYPANTNVLYVDLVAVEELGSNKDHGCLPGMVLNLKKPIVYEDQFGVKHSIFGGRLECTMQSIADHMLNTFPSRSYIDVQGTEDELDTFIVYNERKKVTSSAKRKRRLSDQSLHQTPDGAFLDVMRNAYDLLSPCNIEIPKIEDNSHYIHSVPPFIVLLHPALGPLWEVTRQKFHGGQISKGSELQIELTEFSWRNVELNGSLIIVAENVLGSVQTDENGDPLIHYGYRCGRCLLENIMIINKGIDWNCPGNTYWKHEVQRFECLKVVLHGNAELEAKDVTIEGNHTFEVPNGYRLQITGGNAGLSCKMIPIQTEMMDTGSWFWKYGLKDSHIHLEMVRL